MAKRKSRKRSRNRSRKPRLSRRSLRWRKILISLGCVFAVVVVVYVAYLNHTIVNRFEGKKWALPARVYARPMELFPGKALTPVQMEQELRLLGYRLGPTERAGFYLQKGARFEIFTRGFRFWDSEEPSILLWVDFNRIGVKTLSDGHSGKSLPLARLDPLMIGGIYPSDNEDRLFTRLDETPELLTKALIAVEDRKFYNHYGIDPMGILRALFRNVKSRSLREGGSTITQQLVKNFFLTPKRNLWRKANEAIMAVILDWRYDKNQILEAYCNEIYLGQDGERAIHGFGLASWFYFQRPLNELNSSEIALLVGIVKGPISYNPRKRQQAAKSRRDLVLDILAEDGILDENEADLAKTRDLGIVESAGSITNYPAFNDLVRRQLKRDYPDEDLNSEGLRIFTTMDPLIQTHAEKSMMTTLANIEKRFRFNEDTLEGAAVISSVHGGEVLALIGGRHPRYAGFNRVLDASTQVGSVIKPAVFLTAFQSPDRYGLSTLIDDGPLEHPMHDGTVYRPKNYDEQFHGMVSLQTALAKSYNVATVRLALDVGLENVVKTIKKLGVQKELKAFPSLALGAQSLPPIEVMQMYHTIANDGSYVPLRTIRSVLTAKGNQLKRYEFEISQAFDRRPIYLLKRALQGAVENGTGRGLYRSGMIPSNYKVAGKTGTSNDLRDSWFAGFTGNYVGVVWVGQDDGFAQLTGASGALQVWGSIFSGLNIQALELEMPP